MEKVKKVLMVGAMVIAGVMGLLVPQDAMAGGGVCPSGTKAGQWVENIDDCDESGKSFEKLLKNGIELLLIVVGFLAVIFIIFSGFKYVTSAGDSAKIKQAKDTLVYSIIGLVVALLAFAIVQFVTKQLGL